MTRETGDEPQLSPAAHTLIELASTHALDPGATIRVDPTTDGRAKRAIALISRSGIEIGERLGEGGMSVVDRGTQLALGREVAVKSLRETDDLATLRLAREAWITGHLEHPSIVPVHDVSLDASGHPRIVLKKIAGSAWSAVVRDPGALEKRFGANDALDWNLRTLMTVCNAIHFAHSRGIVHRDLKSDNVMVGEFGEVYVLDWGLGVALEDDGTGRFPLAREIDGIAGTPSYMAPEMLDGTGDRITARTDVYLLGAILHEIVTGAPPHLGRSLPEVLSSVLRSEPKLDPGTPRELADIVRRALARDPAERFESAEAVRVALAAFLQHRASTAIAADATAKLERLEESCKAAEAEAPLAPSGRYDLFGECRFGFREALRGWPDNTVARDGLHRAVVAMVERELRDANPRAAELLLEELQPAPAELVERVARAKELQEAERKRLAVLDRDQSPRIGRRARLQISAAFGVLWTIIPWLGFFVERGDPAPSQRLPLLSSTIMLVLAIAVSRRAREALARTALNRSLVRSVGVVLAAQVVLYAVTLYLGVSYEHTRVLVLCLYAACSALTAAAVEQRLWPAAVGYLVTVAIASVWPAIAWPVESVANLLLTINVLVIWRGEKRAAS